MSVVACCQRNLTKQISKIVGAAMGKHRTHAEFSGLQKTKGPSACPAPSNLVTSAPAHSQIRAAVPVDSTKPRAVQLTWLDDRRYCPPVGACGFASFFSNRRSRLSIEISRNPPYISSQLCSDQARPAREKPHSCIKSSKKAQSGGSGADSRGVWR